MPSTRPALSGIVIGTAVVAVSLIAVLFALHWFFPDCQTPNINLKSPALSCSTANSTSLSASTASPGPQTANLSIGLLGWWKADHNDVDAAGSRPASISGHVGYERGPSGWAFAFDGTGFIEVTPTELPSGSSDRSIVFSVLFNSLFPPDANDEAEIYLLGYGTPTKHNEYAVVLTKSNGIAFTNFGNAISVGELPEIGKWYNVIVTNRASHSELYINGVRTGAGAPFLIETSSKESLHIGGVPQSMVEDALRESDYAWHVSNLKGRIADVRIYDHALNDVEVKEQVSAFTNNLP
jgi:hypothetical protein